MSGAAAGGGGGDAGAAEYDWVAESRKIPALLGDERHGRVKTREGKEGTIKSVEGYDLKTFQWLIEEPKAMVAIQHGYNHYVAEVFCRLATELNELGFSVIAHEHQGQGRSKGPELDIADFTHFADDALAFLRASMDKEMPVFVFGESMGGLIAYHMAQKAPELITGIILFAPMLGVAPEMIPNACTIAMLRGISYVAPQAKLVPVEDHLPRCFSHPKKLEVERHDPIRRAETQFGTRFAREVFDVTTGAQRTFGAFSTPFLCFHGSEDSVTDHSISSTFFKEAGSRDKTLAWVDGSKHVIFYERVDTRQTVFDRMVEWMTRRCDAEAKEAIECSEEIHLPAGTGPWDPVEKVEAAPPEEVI